MASTNSRSTEPRIAGKVARMVRDKGFGFISAGDKNYFFHRSEVGDNYEILDIGDEVTFEPAQTVKGPRALGVELVGS